MPVYDYKCAEHGLFYELVTMADSAKPAKCPKCEALSARVIVLPPEILDMAAETKQAIERNEKARHEPQHSTVDTRAENAEKLKKGCGCKHTKRGGSKLLYTANGEKMFPSMRPWMISH
ncbi:zinc ribbon domain-containing protein [Agarivorans sp. B2Z047]|uniref:zinc ribbon domain-containing protein n=1 Tax=Agarivorans sp. B2Z047 TaxID=2652721 RepID=UPI00128D6868|nr:zinc ribbon domain-containing protein [Agarivorans sp. B2Z047]MPW30764.1 zinc ribbon domain-containing protein [Agarivorans sp. B2Z047]UQN42013.1 zinc ribbon domain-containing protein [Agarivorans sp. B2Z047]